MPTSPWTAIAALDPQCEYLVMATRLLVASRRHIPEILHATHAIWPVLVASDGLLGYSLQARLAHGTLSTLTVWRDRDALNGFVRSAAHASLADKSRPRMAEGTFVSWTAHGASLPPTWVTADKHMNAQAHGM